ncbi:MAG: hypothetical protein RLZZ504_1029, partial [Bacteroidota bacterium]
MATFKQIMKYLGIGILALLLTMIAKTILNQPSSLKKETTLTGLSTADRADIESTALNHLGEALKYGIVGYDDANNDSINHHEILAFHDWLRKTYPLVAQKAQWEVINEHSLLITLKGKSQLPAALFLGHMDVVPAPDSNQWKYGPFRG